MLTLCFGIAVFVDSCDCAPLVLMYSSCNILRTNNIGTPSHIPKLNLCPPPRGLAYETLAHHAQCLERACNRIIRDRGKGAGGDKEGDREEDREEGRERGGGGEHIGTFHAVCLMRTCMCCAGHASHHVLMQPQENNCVHQPMSVGMSRQTGREHLCTKRSNCVQGNICAG
jgi:hypothetical protein